MTAAESRWVTPLYAAAVLGGAVLIVATALAQPFNQNELVQMAPYASGTVREILDATRQPPLDPLLGAAVRRVLGEGQLLQRLVPVLAGIGTLTLFALLLRRLLLGTAARSRARLATAPLFLRWTAYSRPYALPVFLMLLFVYAGHRWLVDRQAPVAPPRRAERRAPTPGARARADGVPCITSAFMALLSPRQASSAGHPPLRGHPGAVRWRCPWPPVAGTRSLATAARGLVYRVKAAAPSCSSTSCHCSASGCRVAGDGGGRRLAVLLPGPRRRLAEWWFFWPLLAAPVVFALAYHLATGVDFTLPYMPRAAYFFAIPFALVVAALTAELANGGRVAKIAIGALLVAVLAGAIPAAARVVIEPDVPDFGEAGRVVSEHVPDNGSSSSTGPHRAVVRGTSRSSRRSVTSTRGRPWSRSPPSPPGHRTSRTMRPSTSWSTPTACPPDPARSPVPRRGPVRSRLGDGRGVRPVLAVRAGRRADRAALDGRAARGRG